MEKLTIEKLFEIRDQYGEIIPSQKPQILLYKAARDVFKLFLTQYLKQFLLKNRKQPEIFISYAWAMEDSETYRQDKIYEGYVEKFAYDLESAGCKVILDRWYDKVGQKLPDFLVQMMRADFLIPIGTHAYLKKYNKRSELTGSPDHVVVAEGSILNHIHSYSSSWSATILPVLLQGLVAKDCFPELMTLNLPIILHDKDYFEAFYKLIGTIFSIDNRDKIFNKIKNKFFGILWHIFLSLKSDSSFEQNFQLLLKQKNDKTKANYSEKAKNIISKILSNQKVNSSNSYFKFSLVMKETRLWIQQLKKQQLAETVISDQDKIFYDKTCLTINSQNEILISSGYELFSKNNFNEVFFLIGEIGSGKTKVMKYWTAKLWQEYAPGEVIPLYLSFAQYKNQYIQIIENYIQQKILSNELWELARHELKQQKWVLFLDDFPELNDDCNLHLLNEWHNWQIKIIISFRNYQNLDVYRKLFVPVSPDEFIHFERLNELILQPLSNNQVIDYLNNYIANKKELPDLIRESVLIFFKKNNALLLMAQNPLLLNLILEKMINLYKKGERIDIENLIKNCQKHCIERERNRKSYQHWSFFNNKNSNEVAKNAQFNYKTNSLNDNLNSHNSFPKILSEILKTITPEEDIICTEETRCTTNFKID